MNISYIWSQLRGTIKENYSFANIKELFGEIGLPIYKISNVQQKWKGGASKGQLMDFIDGLFAEEDSDYQNRIAKNLLKKICESKPELKEKIENVLSNSGWGLTNDNEPFPLRLQLSLINPENQIVTDGINKSLKRYRDGDYSGAITSICGIIDNLTETIYEEGKFANHRVDAFQKRVSKSVSFYESDYKKFLNSNGIKSSDETNIIWNNYKKSISNSAYVLGAFRREFSDVHGFINDINTNIVQNTLDTANYIFSSLINLKERNFTSV